MTNFKVFGNTSFHRATINDGKWQYLLTYYSEFARKSVKCTETLKLFSF